MVTQTQLGVRPAQPKDRPQLTNILHFETYVHRHLDWRPPLDWLGHSPFLVLEKSGKLEAAMACPPDPPGVAWIRLFVTAGSTTSAQAWDLFWPQVQSHFSTQSDTCLAAIPLQNWFELLLQERGFTKSHDVVMFVYDSAQKDNPSPSVAASIRPMAAADLKQVAKVDSAAFAAIWHNSLDSLQLAFRQAVIATVAEVDGNIVGYQISTPSPIGAHLARLAVLPNVQGQGIGYALVADLVRQFHSSAGKSISVNTQNDNLASLALYKKAGFIPTGETYPVYQLQFS
jgi:ribosomal-protein-alanine N-acetyltransferase